MPNSVKRLYAFEDFRLDPAERLLLRAGTPVPLAPKAFEMLIILVSNSGRLLTKEELLRAVWADVVVEENNLDKHISALRKALGESRAETKLIETVRGHGYRFNGSVTEIVPDLSKSTAQVLLENGLEPIAHPIIQPLPQVTQIAPLHQQREGTAEKVESRSWQAHAGPRFLVVLLLGSAIIFWSWFSRLRQSDPPREIKVVRLTNGGNIHNATLSPDGKYFAYTELDGLVVRLFLRSVAGGQPVMLVPELETVITGLTFAPDGQALYFVMVDQSNPLGALYRVPIKGGPAAKILNHIVSPVTFAPDGQRIAFIRLAEDGDKKTTSLVLANFTGSHEQVLLIRSGAEQFGSHGPSWSPDGKEIACQLWYGFSDGRDIMWRVGSVNVQSGALRLLTDQQWDGCGRLAWLRDGRGLVIIGTKQGESGTTARDTVWLISQPDGVPRRITTDLSRHFYSSLGVTSDGQSLLVVPFNRTSQIWSVSAQKRGAQIRYAASSAKQLTTGTSEGRAGIVSLEDGHLVYVARTGEQVNLWRMRDDGSQPQQLTTEPSFLEEVSAPSDGRYYVFASTQAGWSHLFRVNHVGSNLQQVTSGESREIDSDCSPDGRWIVYASLSSQPDQNAQYKLWKISADGGAPFALTENEANSPHFSPDGKWISYVNQEASGQWRVSVISAAGGPPLKTFSLPSAAELNIGCRWTPDGKALTYILKGKSFDNLWRQPLDGNDPEPITDFNSGEIYNYTFSCHDRGLILARGYSIRDVLLIKDYR